MTSDVSLVDVLTQWRYVPLGQWADDMDLFSIVVQVGFAKSKSEARRLHDQGGIRLDGTKTNDPNAYIMFPPGDEPITVKTPHIILSLDRSRVNDTIT
jgi:tyrosyl-tRNA synthetase